uniref:Ribosomal protein S10 n=1 Tax=Cyanophora sudae TaxID=1522369 RepID=A0A873WRV8_9EUKA|nr:ribosomal protein S10 [Cyanophora sudae]QPB15075.1 ribosomal protein S10 [Cyanophora sudae]
MLKIFLFSYQSKLLNIFVTCLTFCLKLKKIPHTVYASPKKCSIITILRSPHVNKNSMEHFKIEKFKYIIHIPVSNKKYITNIFKSIFFKSPAGIIFYIKYTEIEMVKAIKKMKI